MDNLLFCVDHLRESNFTTSMVGIGKIDNKDGILIDETKLSEICKDLGKASIRYCYSGSRCITYITIIHHPCEATVIKKSGWINVWKDGGRKNVYIDGGVEKCRNIAISGEKYCRRHIRKWQSKDNDIIKDIMEEYGVCKDLGNEVLKYLQYTEESKKKMYFKSLSM